MINNGKRNILGVMVNIIDYEAAVHEVIAMAKAQQPLTATALAVHGVMTGALDLSQRYRLNTLDLVLPDGQPVRWALNWLYRAKLKDRVYGPNLMLRLCEVAEAENLPIYLYGSHADVLERLQTNLKKRFPDLKIVGAHPSFFRPLTLAEKNEVVQDIKNSGAQLAFVGLGCPRQEVWIYEHRTSLPMPMLAVGAAFDFHARLIPQAPEWMQDGGLEWFFRFLQEPRRLWRRYLLLNPAYLFLLVLQLLRIRTMSPDQALMPEEDIRFG